MGFLDVFDFAEGSWRALPHLPRPRRQALAACAQGKVYVLGGAAFEPPRGRAVAVMGLLFFQARFGVKKVGSGLVSHSLSLAEINMCYFPVSPWPLKFCPLFRPFGAKLVF